ncbi:MAG: hypothetical protein ACOYOF_11730 [Verrucomicrobiaceae bacterium]
MFYSKTASTCRRSNNHPHLCFNDHTDTSGDVDAEEISGWEQFRAEHLPQAPDFLAKPDLVLAELKDGKVSLHFVKRYGGNMLVVGYGIQGGALAPISFGPRTINQTARHYRDVPAVC